MWSLVLRGIFLRVLAGAASEWWMGGGLLSTYEEREKSESAEQGVRGVQPAVCVAEKVGTGLGRGAVLQ
jgi:hypothetical protein